MVYMVEARIDYNLIGDRLKELLEKEWVVSDELYASGRMLAIWRTANAKGVVAIWNMPDHDAVANQIRAMPLYPYMSEVTVTPLVAHPRFPQFCEPAARDRAPRP
jgi:muconolactone delta-isomerase